MNAAYLSYYLEEDTPCYGGAQGTITFKKSRSISQGDTSNNLHLTFPNHVGTHIDFPYHFNDEGKKLEDYKPDFWLFNHIGFLSCSIGEVPERLDQIPEDIELLILKTGFGDYRGETIYWAKQPVIPAHFAQLFRNKFPLLRVFGFDLLSLTSQLNKAEGKQAHLSFLCENDILVLEDMNLKHIDIAPDKVIISPLLIKHADGAPCTVIAYK
jgi:kynurenine formamidase